MNNKQNKSVDAGGPVGAVLTNLSKPFDCINHEPLVAKLNDYGLNNVSIILQRENKGQGKTLRILKQRI